MYILRHGLLAFEGIFPFVARWIEFCRNQQNLLIEVRTKSANFATIASCTPTENVILAWTLSPQEVVERYEPGTPSLKSRLAAVRSAIDAGWSVRLCFDPVLDISGWRDIYVEFIRYVFSELGGRPVRDVAIGTFRMNRGYLKRIKRQRQDSDILYKPFEINAEVAEYPEQLKGEMLAVLRDTVLGDAMQQHLSHDQVAVIDG